MKYKIHLLLIILGSMFYSSVATAGCEFANFLSLKKDWRYALCRPDLEVPLQHQVKTIVADNSIIFNWSHRWDESKKTDFSIEFDRFGTYLKDKYIESGNYITYDYRKLDNVEDIQRIFIRKDGAEYPNTEWIKTERSASHGSYSYNLSNLDNLNSGTLLALASGSFEICFESSGYKGTLYTLESYYNHEPPLNIYPLSIYDLADAHRQLLPALTNRTDDRETFRICEPFSVDVVKPTLITVDSAQEGLVTNQQIRIELDGLAVSGTGYKLFRKSNASTAELAELTAIRDAALASYQAAVAQEAIDQAAYAEVNSAYTAAYLAVPQDPEEIARLTEARSPIIAAYRASKLVTEAAEQMIEPAEKNLAEFSSDWVKIDYGRNYYDSDGGLHKYWLDTNLIDSANNYLYKLESCIAGLCVDSDEMSIRVETTPAVPNAIAIAPHLKRNNITLDWDDVTFVSNSINPRYKLNWISKSPAFENFGNAADSSAASGTIDNINSSQVLMDFIVNDRDYQLTVQACNSTCSAPRQVLENVNETSTFLASFTPNGIANVLPVDGVSDPANQLPTGSDGNYFSDSGRYKLELTNLNATHFKISEYRKVKGLEIIESSEVKWIPVSMEPTVIIPVTYYKQVQNPTETPIMGPIHSQVNKSTGFDLVTTNWFNQMESGEYRYNIQACSRIDECIDLNPVTLTVDLQIADLASALFHVNDGELEITFGDNNTAPVTYFQIYNAQNQSIGTFENSAEGLAAAVAALSNASDGYTLVACNASACTQAIEITLPPNAPSFVNVTGNNNLGYGHTISWATASGATGYTLEMEVVNPSDTSEVWLAKHTINTSGTSYVFPEVNKTFGLHRYRVMASNAAGDSSYSSLTGFSVELDPTVYIRKQLYYAYEADDRSIQVGDDIDADDPKNGQYDRDNAAFRYLDLMYSKQASADVIEILGDADLSLGSTITDVLGGVLYGDSERRKALLAESYVRSELAGDYSENSNVQKLLLDIYYDRATAEFYLANVWRDRARVLRFTDQGSHFSEEVENLIKAREIYENALFGYYDENNNDVYLPGYADLIDANTHSTYRSIFKTHAKDRGQISPRYWEDSSTVFKIVTDGERASVLASGYKDVTLIYELMAAVLEAKVEEAKLKVMDGGTDELSLVIDETALAELREKVTSLHLDLLDENIGLFSDELDELVTNEDWNGFKAAKSRYHNADAQVDTALGWLRGDTNILGLPNDMMVFNHEEASNRDSFDVYMSEIGAVNSPYNQVVEYFNEAANSYNLFKANNDAADAYARSNLDGWVTQLKSLIGYDCDIECAETVSGWEVSQITLQAKSIIEAQNNAEIAEEQLAGLLEKIENKRATLKIIYENNNIQHDVLLSYGQMQVNIGKRITKLQIDAARKAARKSSRLGLSDIVSAASTGNPGLAFVSLAGSMAAKQEQWDIAKIGINASKNIGALTALSSELALEQQIQINTLTTDSQEAVLAEQLEAMWIDANLLALTIEQSALRVEIESDKLTLLLDQTQYAIDKIAGNSESLMNRYFADPVHARRVTYAMDQASRVFEDAQLQMFLAANALEYKLGLNLLDGDSGFNKNAIFKARTHEQLTNFHAAMVAYNQRNAVVPQQAYARFSTKEDILGYKRKIVRTYIEPSFPGEEGYWQVAEAAIYEHPDSSNTELLKADEAFTARVEYELGQFENFVPTDDYANYNEFSEGKAIYFYEANNQTWMAIRFDTVQSFNDLAHGSLFQGPTLGDISTNSDLCYSNLGTYADKINRVAVLTTTSNNRADIESVGLGIRYGGNSFLRLPEAPNLDEAASSDNPDYPVQALVEYYRLKDIYDDSDYAAEQSDIDDLKSQIQKLASLSDVASFDTRFWAYDLVTGNLSSTSMHRLTNTTRIVGSTIEAQNLEAELSGYWIDGLKERSVASSSWVIEMPVTSDSRGTLIGLDVLQDIELVIDHEFIDRRNTFGDLCPLP